MNQNKVQAEQYKQQGNERYGSGDYEGAKQLYTRAIRNIYHYNVELCPSEFTYYGNRSACYLALEQYFRFNNTS